MRSINDIIKELVEHPEYVHHEIWTKVGVREFIAFDFNIEEPHKLVEIISDEDYSDFGDFITNVYEYGLSDMEFDYSPEFQKKIQRHIKLNDLFID